MRTLIVIVVLIVLAALGGAWYWHSGSAADVVYRTAPIQRGDLVSTISATGTLEPEEVIDVGAQVAGLIEALGKDANGNQIDYRSPVEPDMVLAHIDDTVYKADVDTAAAQLEQAKTSIAKGEADLSQAQAKLVQAENNWNRAKTMGTSDALSQNDYDMYQADYESAKANVSVASVEISQAKSGVALADATLAKARRNLDFCTIRSPVKGVIIDRRVNIGQTVVSSLNAPSLFLIAKDLSRMQIWVAVNEVDVGRITAGTPVTFTCDTFPDMMFEGSVEKVRLNATMSQNVVMYTVEVRAENPKSILLPYLTAKVRFEVERQNDVLTVPNVALRWYPMSALQVIPDARSSWKPIEPPQPGASAEPKAGGKQKHQPTTAPKERRATIWIKEGEFVRPVEVKAGFTDGTRTAIVSDQVHEGAEVVTGEITETTETSEKNPFIPQMPRRR
jgi:HlyD family secretion protein